MRAVLDSAGELQSTRPMQSRLAFLGLGFASLVVAAGCAPRFRADIVAHASVSARPDSAMSLSLPVQEAGVTHRIRYHLVLPRALQLAYTVSCPGVEQNGLVGETFEVYRTRRLAQLERERQKNAALVGGLVGAVAPKAKARVETANENGTATAEGEVDPGAAVEGAVYAASDAPTLPEGDVGAQVRDGTLELVVATPGECTFALRSDIAEQDTAGVTADVTLEKIVDVRAERDAARAAARAKAAEGARGFRVAFTTGLETRGARRRTKQEQWQAQMNLRVALNASLVGRGADPQKRARERAAAEAERQRKYEISWRAGEERRRARAALDYERDRLRRERWAAESAISQRGLGLRAQLTIRLTGLGADPTLRRRQQEAELRAWEQAQAQRAEERRQAEAQLRLESESSLAIRGSVKLHLQALGAVDRPPRPLDVVETPPPPPFAGAAWIGGGYSWNGVEWVWMSGHYERPPEANVVWVAPVRVHVGASVSIRPGRWVKVKGKTVQTRDHRR